MSTLIKPANSEIHNYREVLLPCRTPDEIINLHGKPYYIKIDVENYDLEILKSLKENNIFPVFLSFECHNISTFTYLKSNFEYKFFNIVFGNRISYEYKNHLIRTNVGESRFNFKTHSAGPFGTDIKYPWLSVRDISKILSWSGGGWIDIHCTNEDIKRHSSFLTLTLLRIKNYSYINFFRIIKIRNKFKGKLKKYFRN